MIRLAHPDDELTLRRLAELDSARPLVGSVLIAEASGIARAALGLRDGRTVADPFFPTTDLVDLLQAIDSSTCSKDTMVIVTYDEFGGQWDHVPPPGQGVTSGPHDLWGPGTRIPALIVSPFLRGEFVVDHTQYDTTSILATVEARFGLAPLSTRDAAVNDLSNVFDAKQVEAGQ